jgi:uncharacterized protein
MSGFRVDVADLLSHPGARREVSVRAALDELAGSAARVEGPVQVDLTLDRISDGIVASGTVSAEWRADCSLCLKEIGHRLEVHVDELFEPSPVEGETYPIVGHEIDLEQLVRDAIVLELPLAPHCEPPCAAPVAGDTDEEATDPRWAALSELEL